MEWWPPLFVTAADRHQILAHSFPQPIAHALFAALSADPASLIEWLAATRRFIRDGDWPWPNPTPYQAHPLQLLPAQQPPGNGEPDRAQQLFVFLPGRLAAATSPERFPLRGTVPLIRNRTPSSQMLLYGLRDDWRIIDWHDLPARLAEPDLADFDQLQAQKLSNARRVLYDALPGWICQQRADHPDLSPTELHRQWLTSPRADLDDKSPRQALFYYLDHIDRDLEYQQHNWIVTSEAPPGLDPESQAYRAAPFGRFELSVYHLMTRAMILYCDRELGGIASSRRAAAAVRVAKQLDRWQADWLAQPLTEFHDQVAADISRSERQRIPPTVDATQLADCHCPICRTLNAAEPLFWLLDFPPLEHEFLFSFCKTRDEWDKQIAFFEAHQDDDWEGVHG